MLTGGYSWRLYFYVVLAFAVALFIFSFFAAEETSYDRKLELVEEPSNGHDALPPRRPFLQTLSLKGKYDPSVPFFMTMIRSFTYFLVPQVLWVVTTFGIY